jgi:gamma-glutamyltranspeptidase/glutathione hydrolase
MRLTNVARGSLTLDEGGISYFLSEANVERYRHELSQILAGAAPPAEPAAWQGPNDTTHISVIDGEGNMVSLTTSAGEGAGFVVGDSGVVLNNMLGEIDLHPHGFHQAPGGLRLQTMMSPTLILKDSRPVLTVGSGGSSRLRSAILQVLTNVIDFEMLLEAAVHAPRVHLEEGVVQLEGGISPDVGDELAALGYRVNRWPGLSLYFGGAHSAGIVQGELVAVGDRRRGGVGLSSESTEN